MKVTVRPARRAEYGAIGRLTVAAYEASGQLTDEHGYRRALADAASRAKRGLLLAAVDDRTGRPLGSVTFVLPGDEYAHLSHDPDEAEFRMLAVDPAVQGRGIGRLLVHACLDRARELNRRAVVICYRDHVAAARRLYTATGFERLPERDWQPAPGVQLLAMRAVLDPSPAR